MTGFLPRRRTAGLVVVMLLFLAVISGFGGLYSCNGSLRVRQNPAGCFLHQLLYVSLDRLLAETWLWSTCSARPARQQRSLACCTLSLAHLTNLDFQAPMKPVPGTLQEGCLISNDTLDVDFVRAQRNTVAKQVERAANSDIAEETDSNLSIAFARWTETTQALH